MCARPRQLACTVGLALLVGACGPRQVEIGDGDPAAPDATSTTTPTAKTPTSEDVPEADALRRACELPPGVHTAGDTVAGWDLDEVQATFKTDGPRIDIELPLRGESGVLIQASYGSSGPLLPDELLLEALPGEPDAWNVTVQLWWCNDMECRAELYAGSREPTDRLEGWLAFEGERFSDLARITACVSASDDGGKRSLTVNATAVRAAH
jgi:hypothetical protein